MTSSSNFMSNDLLYLKEVASAHFFLRDKVEENGALVKIKGKLVILIKSKQYGLRISEIIGDQ